MCNCLEQISKNTSEFLQEKVKKSGVDIVTVDENETGFVNLVLSMSKNGGWKLMMPFELVYTARKKDDSVGKPRKEKISVFPSFCPFCGEKQNKE